ncbi:hypothetical protein C2W64_01953 [Brevibacillus laterosporus]|nr:hypothetical protein C2W64_01953 [Brevibacillus laterosporus]
MSVFGSVNHNAYHVIWFHYYTDPSMFLVNVFAPEPKGGP